MFPSLLTWLVLGCTPLIEPDALPPGEVDADGDVDVDTDTDTDSDTDTDTPTVEVVLTGVTPSLGSNGGGQEVVVSGEDLSAVDRVIFGSSEGVVLSTTSGTVTVELPETLREGRVSVSVRGPGISGSLSDAFTFLPDRTGADGGLGIHVLTRSVGYEAEDGDFGSSELWLFEGHPVFDVHDFIGPEGVCLDENPEGASVTLTDRGVDAVGLANNEGTSLRLALREDGAFSTLLSSNEDYGPEAVWDVALASGEWPAFTLYDVFSPGAPTAFTEPLLGSGEPEVSGSQTFTWNPRGGDWMFIAMNLYWREWWENSYSHVESRRCLVENTGTWTMDPGIWADWPDHFWNFGYLEVTSGEIQNTAVTLPDGADITWLTALLTHGGAYTKD